MLLAISVWVIFNVSKRKHHNYTNSLEVVMMKTRRSNSLIFVKQSMKLIQIVVTNKLINNYNVAIESILTSLVVAFTYFDNTFLG